MRSKTDPTLDELLDVLDATVAEIRSRFGRVACTQARSMCERVRPLWERQGSVDAFFRWREPHPLSWSEFVGTILPATAEARIEFHDPHMDRVDGRESRIYTSVHTIRPVMRSDGAAYDHPRSIVVEFVRREHDLSSLILSERRLSFLEPVFHVRWRGMSTCGSFKIASWEQGR